MVGLTCRVGAHNSRYAHDTRLRPVARISKGGGFIFGLTQSFPAGGGRCKPPAGSRAEPRRQTHFGKQNLEIGLNSCL